jgi:Protein of unknown function (DUF3305)
LISSALMRINVGVVVERHTAKSPWLDFLWQPVAVLEGEPSAEPWTPITTEPEVTTFYAGQAEIELHRTETANYRDNLASGAPLLWVVLRATQVPLGMDLLAVIADPAEGEALTGAGTDLVAAVPMPASIRSQVEAFVAEHHVERPHYRRQIDRTGLTARRTGSEAEDQA